MCGSLGGEKKRRDATRDRKYPVSQHGVRCVWVVRGEMQKTMGRATKEEKRRGRREKSERAGEGERKEGRGERQRDGEEGRKEEGERQMKTRETRGKETSPPSPVLY